MNRTDAASNCGAMSSFGCASCVAQVNRDIKPFVHVCVQTMVRCQWCYSTVSCVAANVACDGTSASDTGTCSAIASTTVLQLPVQAPMASSFPIWLIVVLAVLACIVLSLVLVVCGCFCAAQRETRHNEELRKWATAAGSPAAVYAPPDLSTRPYDAGGVAVPLGMPPPVQIVPPPNTGAPTMGVFGQMPMAALDSSREQPPSPRGAPPMPPTMSLPTMPLPTTVTVAPQAAPPSAAPAAVHTNVPRKALPQAPGPQRLQPAAPLSASGSGMPPTTPADNVLFAPPSQSMVTRVRLCVRADISHH
jgi:hypothetical protein